MKWFTNTLTWIQFASGLHIRYGSHFFWYKPFGSQTFSWPNINGLLIFLPWISNYLLFTRHLWVSRISWFTIIIPVSFTSLFTNAFLGFIETIVHNSYLGFIKILSLITNMFTNIFYLSFRKLFTLATYVSLNALFT
jgi:hypothetical protein